MPMRITMLVPRRSEDGLSVMTPAGSPYTVGDDFGVWMVRNGYALDTDNVLPRTPDQLTLAQIQAFNQGRLLDSTGAVRALSEASPVITITATGTAISGANEYGGYVVRAVAGGTPTLTLYDATSATGTPIVGPVNITATGPFPWMGPGTTQRRVNTTGLHAVIGGTGTCTIDLLDRAV